MFRRILVVCLGLLTALALAAETRRLGLGRSATAADFARQEALVGPGGLGLPTGRGTGAQGGILYAERCAACHGAQGGGTSEFPALVGGRATMQSASPQLTLGSYWPFATTVWDYVNRAMPYPDAGTLKTDEVYALTAYLFAMNKIIPMNYELNERTLPAVKMPNRDGFVPDPRPDVK